MLLCSLNSEKIANARSIYSNSVTNFSFIRLIKNNLKLVIMYLNKITLVVLLFFSLTMVNGQTINGDWSGKLNAMGQEFPLVIHFSGNDDDLAATMDSPSQGATVIPVEKVSLEGTQLSLSLMGGQIEYTAEVNGDSMTGNFKQGGMDMPLTLTKGELEKPGDTSLPSSEEELKVLANKETGDYKVRRVIIKKANSLHRWLH